MKVKVLKLQKLHLLLQGHTLIGGNCNWSFHTLGRLYGNIRRIYAQWPVRKPWPASRYETFQTGMI